MNFITEAVVKAVKTLYQTDVNPAEINLQETRKEFEGQVTLVTFPFTKVSRKSPEQTGMEIGEFLKSEVSEISAFNVIKGFLNISLADSFWLDKFYAEILTDGFASFKPNGKKVMVEYSSPNTNKPLHLGHVRNNLLGYSVAKILEAAGYEVIKANLVNDRGIHICKSMLAWQKYGNGETPESSGLKGDHLVGKYYVIFDKELKLQLKPILNSISNGDLSLFSSSQINKLREYISNINNLTQRFEIVCQTVSSTNFEQFGFRAQVLSESAIDKNILWKDVLRCFDDEEYDNLSNKEKELKEKELRAILKPIIEIEKKLSEQNDEIKEIAQTKAPLMIEAQKMLLKWEAGDRDTINLWKKMNTWVYNGFAETYSRLGVDFDKYYYESNTYLLGKDIVEEGLGKGVFYKKNDGSIWVDLTADGLDEKLVLRADGTSVYITQDLGTAQLKYDDFNMDKSIYVVGNEQDYHFKVLFLILEKLGKTWARGLYHLSYGMVDLPSGKMKSREGTVVDADELITQMEETAKVQTEALGKIDEFDDVEKQELYHTIGMGALKYFLLKVDPQKRLLFNPNESIDFLGHTGPFIQYTHARIRSVLSRTEAVSNAKSGAPLFPEERELILTLGQFPEIIETAARGHTPAIIANYVYEVAKAFNKFYHERSILQADDEQTRQFRLQLSAASAKVIKKGMGLLGIEVPERM